MTAASAHPAITGITSLFFGLGQAYQLTPPTQVLTHHMSCSGPMSVIKNILTPKCLEGLNEGIRIGIFLPVILSRLYLV